MRKLSREQWNYLCDWHKNFGIQFLAFWFQIGKDLSEEELNKRHEIMCKFNDIDDLLYEFSKENEE